ncbi:5'-methylthioadenosine/S-adenosylhomocysteine nucleosidase [Kitasatospora sp. NPDC051853]|uniref:5'-methylthioadenosine/S-adenosylhomocysteine nucleosidase n=1 Tax=Kitasatospora sp. NPDC051853 TaxID=3364058 RepID=UPI00379E5E73
MSGTVVVLTALGLEFEAVQAYLTDSQHELHPTGTVFEVGRLQGTERRVALAETGPGNQSAALVAEHARQLFSPVAMLFVGVAGAVKDDLHLGDVVVATKVQAYQGGKETRQGFLARPEGWQASHALLQLAKHVLRPNQPWTDGDPASRPTVHFKPVGAGDVLLNSAKSPLRTQLHQHYNDVVAVEMESAGLAHAAHIAGVDALTVRGISDRADGRKYAAADEEHQPRAAANAAAAAMAIVRRLP